MLYLTVLVGFELEIFRLENVTPEIIPMGHQFLSLVLVTRVQTSKHGSELKYQWTIMKSHK